MFFTAYRKDVKTALQVNQNFALEKYLEANFLPEALFKYFRHITEKVDMFYS